MSQSQTVTSTTIFQELCNLTFLNISYNYIEMISPGSFANLSLLKVLDLSANSITTITSDTFKGLVALQVLRLEQNQLIHISGNSLKGLTSLTNLNLDLNNLTSLHENLFVASNILATLTLSCNQLVTLNSRTFDPILPTLKTLNISGNPLLCNCENRWLVDKLGRVLVAANETLCSVTSASLEPVRGKAITSFVTGRYCPSVTPYFCDHLLHPVSLYHNYCDLPELLHNQIQVLSSKNLQFLDMLRSKMLATEMTLNMISISCLWKTMKNGQEISLDHMCRKLFQKCTG